MFKEGKRCLIKLSLVALIFFVCYKEVLADEIILKNGDRLTGTITKVEGGILVLTTEYADPIKIKVDRIKSVNSEHPVNVHLFSGEILKGVIKTGEDNRMIIESSVGREKTVIEWDKVVAINPPPVILQKWKGNVTLGANLQTGNTDRTSMSIGAEVSRKTKQDRFSIKFLHNYAEDNDEITARNTYGSLKYDYFFIKSLYGYLGIELFNDKFKDLNLQTVVGPGIGYQILDDPQKSLLIEVGASYFSEDLKEGEDDQWVTGRFACNFSYQFIEKIIFSDNLIIYPSFKEMGEYQLRNEAVVTSALGANWALKLTNILERDSDPPEGVEKDDFYWILALQYSF